MLRQATDFRDESAALHALIEPLDERALRCATDFKGWTIEDVVGHLHLWNHAADLALREPEAFAELMQHIRDEAPADIRGFERAWRGELAGRALVAAWRDRVEEVADHFGRADPAARVPWAGPSMSVRSSITARLMETWAHGQEVYDLLGVERTEHDRIHNIVVLGVNTYGWTFRNRGETPPEPVPHLRLTAPSGVTWTFGEAREDELVEGSATAFCQVVTQVRNIADTGLAATGTNASSWMQRAQCFAGPPSRPPPPGTRRRRIGRAP